jgi:SAM-dependent methyltransferase
VAVAVAHGGDHAGFELACGRLTGAQQAAATTGRAPDGARLCGGGQDDDVGAVGAGGHRSLAPSDRVRDADRVGAGHTVGDVAQVTRRAGRDARERVALDDARWWLVGDAARAVPAERRARHDLLFEHIDEQVAARVGAIAREVLGHRDGVKPPVVPVGAVLAELASQTRTYEEVVVADAASLPFADDTFDLVLAFMSLQDMDDAAGALRQAARVLIPKGRVVAAFVHPFASAHLGRDATFRRSYFDVQLTLDEVERDGIAFAFHQIHRPLHAWLALFLDAGFVLEDIREQRPSDADVIADPTLAKTRVTPAFLHLRGSCQGSAAPSEP